MKKIEDLKVQIFADGADKAGMLEMHEKPFVKGLTTNPTLMKKVGITDYAAFCKDILIIVIASNCNHGDATSIADNNEDDGSCLLSSRTFDSALLLRLSGFILCIIFAKWSKSCFVTIS